MRLPASHIQEKVKAFCAQIGVDSLLVQGAGGNVSWKESGVLWIKASGTWLAEAELKEIFVPVNLLHLQGALSRRDFFVQPEVIGISDLRPSIETLLHALMPHTVVVHLHAIEILAHMVQVNAINKIKTHVGDSVKWVFVEYFKPGSALASGVFDQMNNRPDADVVFLANHGVIIGGESLEEIFTMLKTLVAKLQSQVSQSSSEITQHKHKLEFSARGYIPCSDVEVNQLAGINALINRVRREWALYPDHLVFLGSEPVILESSFAISDLDQAINNRPPFIFLVNDGVYEDINVTEAQKKQLRCYYDVIKRQDASVKLSTLSKHQIFELINWDAEIFRKFSR